MKYLLWFFAGCVCIGVPFFIGYDQHDMWNSVFGGMIGGTVFLTMFYFFIVRKEFLSKWKIFTASLFALHIFAFAAFTVTSYRTASLQRENLYKMISYSFNGGIVHLEFYRRTLSTLHHYYNQPTGEKKSFVDVFSSLYGNKIYSGTFEINESQAPRGTFVTYQGDSLVQLVAASSDAFAKGIRPDFANINGLTGKIQYTATMSKYGVTYERNN